MSQLIENLAGCLVRSERRSIRSETSSFGSDGDGEECRFGDIELRGNVWGVLTVSVERFCVAVAGSVAFYFRWCHSLCLAGFMSLVKPCCRRICSPGLVGFKLLFYVAVFCRTRRWRAGNRDNRAYLTVATSPVWCPAAQNALALPTVAARRLVRSSCLQPHLLACVSCVSEGQRIQTLKTWASRGPKRTQNPPQSPCGRLIPPDRFSPRVLCPARCL